MHCRSPAHRNKSGSISEAQPDAQNPAVPFLSKKVAIDPLPVLLRKKLAICQRPHPRPAVTHFPLCVSAPCGDALWFACPPDPRNLCSSDVKTSFRSPSLPSESCRILQLLT
jgi:hypothetical protein